MKASVNEGFFAIEVLKKREINMLLKFLLSKGYLE